MTLALVQGSLLMPVSRNTHNLSQHTSCGRPLVFSFVPLVRENVPLMKEFHPSAEMFVWF